MHYTASQHGPQGIRVITVLPGSSEGGTAFLPGFAMFGLLNLGIGELLSPSGLAQSLARVRKLVIIRAFNP
jgi:hypothetical protein